MTNKSDPESTNNFLCFKNIYLMFVVHKELFQRVVIPVLLFMIAYNIHYRRLFKLTLMICFELVRTRIFRDLLFLTRSLSGLSVNQSMRTFHRNRHA